VSILTSAKSAIKGLAEKILYVDDTSVARDQLRVLEDYYSKFYFDTNTDDLQELAGILKKKHFVDSICVSQNNGSMIVSTNGQDLNEAVIGTALFNYIQSEIPKSEAVMIKSKDWFMLYPYEHKIYIVKAPASLSVVELRAIAKDMECFFSKRKK